MRKGGSRPLRTGCPAEPAGGTPFLAGFRAGPPEVVTADDMAVVELDVESGAGRIPAAE